MDAVRHIADVVHHAVYNVSGGRLVHIRNRQTAQFFRKANAKPGCEISADDVMQQELITIRQTCLEGVNAEQYADLGQQALSKALSSFFSPCVKPVYQITEHFGNRYGAADKY